jgi:hypothetical protein
MDVATSGHRGQLCSLRQGGKVGSWKPRVSQKWMDGTKGATSVIFCVGGVQHRA